MLHFVHPAAMAALAISAGTLNAMVSLQKGSPQAYLIIQVCNALNWGHHLLRPGEAARKWPVAGNK
jgi:hypothetical protein